ncbi:5' nucleotidase, NT5C type [Mycolicibacterium austroafricanum]|uniref:5' nucleotidase, NT5C type n=1 Tax=Mycolicibacterium austroafricanum TaxID=39687 RepID=UPI00055CB772|nr:hypothetical protein [Mycolicibacterium austroafricanum]
MPTEKLHIGLDVDGVLADYMGAAAQMGRIHGHQIADAAPLTYGLVEPGWFPNAATAAAVMRAVHLDGLEKLTLFDSTAPAAVAHLRTAGHRVTIVTARDPEPDGRSGLSQWLHQHGIGFDELHFEAVKSRSGCDVYLDDAPHNIAEIRAAGRHGVVRDTTYNRHVDGPRVTSLAEFAAMVRAGRFVRSAA